MKRIVEKVNKFRDVLGWEEKEKKKEKQKELPDRESNPGLPRLK